ncbi:MAG TPA: alpha/beta hydrolase [Kofleriaceae bacterium]|jgi:pimeloyl-ACP methyl ester carboxylesterase
MPTRLLLIHGSAADSSTWSIQRLSPFASTFELIAYDRPDLTTVEAAADDAVARLGDDPTPALVAGSSFGAVVALDAIRRYPARFAGAILIEPPMTSTEEPSSEQRAMFAAFDEVRAAKGDEAAAELFLRTVLGDAAYERMPKAFQDRSKAKAAQIRADSVALLAYRPRYAELSSVTLPVLLLGGDRSFEYFAPTLAALERSLPNAKRVTVANAGHMLHAEAHRTFAQLVTDFANGSRPAESRSRPAESH